MSAQQPPVVSRTTPADEAARAHAREALAAYRAGSPDVDRLAQSVETLLLLVAKLADQ